ncbi:MAG: amidohydrolase family protein [Gemmatimonadaceae bacterium]
MRRHAIFLIATLTACAAGSPRADLILHNARVYTMAWPEPGADGRPAAGAPWDSAQGWHPDASAVAVRNGRVLYVGADSGALALRGSTTQVLDLAGAVLLPGMIDAHTHVAELGQSLDRVNLTGVATEAEAVEKVVQRAASTPKGEWILGWGWDEGAWANRYPDKRLLSERVPDHPVLLRGLHGFAAWANERALADAHITASTAAPTGGEIRHEKDGSPSGLFMNRAVELVTAAVPHPTPAQRDSQVVRALRVMADNGYTGVHEAGTPRDVLEAFQRLDAKGALPVRVYVMLDARDSALVREWIKRGPLVGTDSSMLVVRSVKAYYDGALGSRGAQLLADYSDRPGHRGVSGAAYGFDHRLAADAMAAGFQIGIHAIGDAGNRSSLDFIDSVQSAAPGARNLRHRIEHAQVVHPLDIPRFATLGVIASMQPPHAVEDMPWAEERLGPERVRGAYAWRTLRQAGARLVFSSDLPGSDWNLFYGWHSAMTRQDKKGAPDGGWYPDQRMSAEETVRGYSTWGAYAAFDEQSAGTIAVGKRADFTAVSVDPFHLTSNAELLSGKVQLTVGRGRVIERGATQASR